MAVVITLSLVVIGCCIIVCVLCAYIHIHGQKITCVFGKLIGTSVAEAQDSGKLGINDNHNNNIKYYYYHTQWY